MEISVLTEEYVQRNAVNASALANASKISAKDEFSGRKITADRSLIYGDCKGSGKEPYHTSVDVSGDTVISRCSCPSRQFPCKHALALMLDYAAGKSFETGEVPEDVARKREKIEKREEKAKQEATAEATPKSEEELQKALSILSVAPLYADELWLSSAFEVRKRFPNLGYESLGVPTWLYGHEPSTPLATHIAKYFENSIREDGILSISKGGIIYTPGSAGTLQEVFQEAVQNHYLTFGYASPMIFMGKQFWTEEVPVWPLIMDLVEKGRYKNLILCLTDEPDEAERVLLGK